MRARRIRTRANWLAVGVALLGVLAGCAGATGQANTTHTTQPQLEGTLLSGAAPAFTLRDQTGATVSLAQFRGEPVVLTFVDSICTNECPLTAMFLNQTAAFLGPKANDVAWIAMSVDPWSDTPATAQAFLTKNKVTMPFHFTLGSVATLTPLWKAYHIGVEQTPGDITHTVGSYLIDQQGNERVWLDEGFDPKVLSDDISILLAS